MSRGPKIALIAAASVVGLVIVVFVAGIIVVQTAWFRDFVRGKIVSAVDDSTGGKTEIGAFNFDWRHLRAEARNVVIHGLESPAGPPLFRANLIEVDLTLKSPSHGFAGINYLLLDTPQANVIVYPDGHTNLPAPKPTAPSNKSGLQTVVDLAIGRFDLRNGSAVFSERKSDFSANGENLRVRLDYNSVHPGYTGELDIAPLHLQNARNAPLNVDVRLPLTLEDDRIALAGGSLRTPESLIRVSASMEHLAAPRMAASINASLSLPEIRNAAGLSMPLDTTRGPNRIIADISASTRDNRILVQNVTATLGQSRIHAAGTLEEPNRPGRLQFTSVLNVGEIGRLLRVSARPDGTILIGGTAGLAPGGNYQVAANITGRGLAAGQGSSRVTGATLAAALTADPRQIMLTGLRLTALGGDLTGSGTVADMNTFHLSAMLNHFGIRQIAQLANPGRLGYSGTISGGVQADGSVKNAAGVAARAALAIQPAPGGVPVSGRINIDYDGRAGAIQISPSYIALPNTRLDLAGSLNRQIQVRLTTHNMADFRPVADVPVSFSNGGNAALNAVISGSLSMPRISAQAAVSNFSVEGRPFTSLNAAIAASSSGASVTNAVLTRNGLQARVNATVGLRDWKPEKSEPVRADATIRDADLSDILALAGRPDFPAQGSLAADAHIEGSIGDPRGSASLSVNNGVLEGTHFDSLTTRVAMLPGLIQISSLQWIAGPARLDANAAYQHAANDLSRGTLRAHVATSQIQLAQFQPLLKDRPGLGGQLSLNADASASLAPAASGTQFQLTALTANFSVRGMQLQGNNLGNLTAAANTSGANLAYNLDSDFAGSTIRVSGQSLLSGDHQTQATAQIANLSIDRVLTVAGRHDLPVSGTFSASGQVSGTLAAPQASATLSVANGSAYQQRFNRLQATIQYGSQLIDVSQFQFQDGPNRIDASGSFAHPPNNFSQGQIRFRVQSSPLQLARIHAAGQLKPGLTGSLEVSADGDATLRPNAVPLFSALMANVSARGLAVDRKPVGDATLTAETRGRQVAFNLTSDFAKADIRGDGTLGLERDNPVNARVRFSNVTYSGLGSWIGTSAPAPFDASVDGQLSLSGPLQRMDALMGELQLSKLEAHSVSPSSIGPQPRVQFAVHNDGPVVVQLDRSVVTVRSARIAGPQTTFSLAGSAPLQSGQPMNLRVDGNVQLALLEAFDPSIFSSGALVLNAAVKGTVAKPSITGRLQLQNASVNMLNVPNGLNNANANISFNGAEAVIQNFSAESGGGKLMLAGSVGYGGPELTLHLQAQADKVHIRYPASLTTEASANIRLEGTTSSSLASGTVRISQVAMHSHTDIGAMLTSASGPPTSPSVSSGFLAGMKFDIRVLTTPGLQFRTSLTENLQADANLTLRGNPDHPGMLGRVVINQGTVVFFGNKYNVDQGTISFFDPSQITPILGIDLSTTVQGVSVTLSVSGPVDKMTLSYHSDPPLEFKDIVSLLATGTPPSTDPVLAARQAPPPQQSMGQAGASLLLGQAVASPISGRLQRLFGVNKLKIDPQVSGATNTPEATLTLEQQINNSITFTYIQDVTQSNPQTIRIQWAIDPTWSAILARDVTGEVNLDLFYKKRFR